MSKASDDTLLVALEQRHERIRTRSLDISFNELADMYENRELKIDPDFQRLFQWSEGAQSRFIESLLLELPIPPLYAVETEEGTYELIDGLQRFSSYLHFRGKLDAPHKDILSGEFLKLEDCNIVAELNGLTWADLPLGLQIRLKRSFVRMEIIRSGSDPQAKYHMFQRLNTGGTLLSPQNVRNCTIRLIDAKFNDFVIKLSRTSDYQACISILTEDSVLQAYDQALVLRFFALKNWESGFTHNVDDFLDNYMYAVTTGELAFEYGAEEANFAKTFALLARTLGDLAFAQPNRRGTGFTRGFSVYHFEAITVGLQTIVAKLDPDDKEILETLKAKIEEIKSDPTFIGLTTGGGKNSKGPLRDRITFVASRLQAHFP